MSETLWVSLALVWASIGYLLLRRRSIINRLHLYCWRKNFAVKIHQRVFEALYLGTNGFLLSKSARRQNDSPELIYGEILFEPFVALLSCCRISKETIFMDLGSGTGKAVIAAAMVYPLRKAIGVEKLEPLFCCAAAQKHKLIQQSPYGHLSECIEFLCGDFLHYDLRQADLVFINATAFIGEPWHALVKHLRSLKKNCQCISISKKLPEEDFTLVQTKRMQVSWGVIFAYIYRKK